MLEAGLCPAAGRRRGRRLIIKHRTQKEMWSNVWEKGKGQSVRQTPPASPSLSLAVLLLAPEDRRRTKRQTEEKQSNLFCSCVRGSRLVSEAALKAVISF